MEKSDKILKKWFRAFPELKLCRGNHDCNFVDTEFLTTDGWKDIYNYNGERIANFDMITNEIYFDKPISYIPIHEKETVTIEGYATKQVVSEQHDVVVGGEKVKAVDLLDSKLKTNDIATNGWTSTRGIELTDFQIALCCWTVLDGTIVSRSEVNKRIQFKLSKPDKIENLRNLLDLNRCKYTFRKAQKSGVNKLQPYYICIYGDMARTVFDLLEGRKLLPNYFSRCNRHQVDIVLDTIVKTDGWYAGNRIVLVSVEPYNINLLQTMFATNGYTSYVKADKGRSGFENGKLQYEIHVCIKTNKQSPVKVFKSGVKEVFGFEMPRGTMVTRIDGKVAFTGNCLVDRKGKTVGLPKRCFKPYREIWQLPDGWEDDFHFTIDGVIYQHSAMSGKLAHLNIAISNRASTVIGHGHSFAGIAYTASPRDCIFGMNVGCGIDAKALAFAYGKDFPHKPIVACATVENGENPQIFRMPL